MTIAAPPTSDCGVSLRVGDRATVSIPHAMRGALMRAPRIRTVRSLRNAQSQQPALQHGPQSVPVHVHPGQSQQLVESVIGLSFWQDEAGMLELPGRYRHPGVHIA